MKIKKVVLAKGFGGYFWDDEAAMKAGAKPDGFAYRGKPLTRVFLTFAFQARPSA